MTADKLLPSVYKSGNFMYVCTPRIVSKNTDFKIYNASTGALVNELDANGIVTGFMPNIQMQANAPWGAGLALCDVFVLQDEAAVLTRLQGINTATHEWWSTNQWSYNT